MIFFSLVIPCFNEEATIKLILDRTENSFIENSIELILVNNGSTDNSEQVLKQLIKEYKHAKYIHLEKNRGYGGGILEGLKHCKGEIIGWTHADLQTDPLDSIKAFKYFNIEKQEQNLFVKGNRRNRAFSDHFFTFGMSIFETILFRRVIYDINAQPTVFSKKFYQSWVNPPNDFSLDLYSYYLAIKKRYQVKRIKVKFASRIAGESKWNTGFTSKIKFILRTIKYSLKLASNDIN